MVSECSKIVYIAFYSLLLYHIINSICITATLYIYIISVLIVSSPFCFTHILTLHCNLFCISHETIICIKLYAIAILFYTVKHIVIFRIVLIH